MGSALIHSSYLGRKVLYRLQASIVFSSDRTDGVIQPLRGKLPQREKQHDGDIWKPIDINETDKQLYKDIDQLYKTVPIDRL